MILSKKQTKALDFLEDKVTEELVFGGGAGGGKSMLGCYWLAKMCFKYPESRWVMGRKAMTTLKETTYVSFLKMAKIQGLTANVDYFVTGAQHKENPNCIVFPNGSVILMRDLGYYPSDPEFDDLGSLEITGAFIDEANQVTAKAKQIIGTRMRHNITKYGIVPKLLMTCNPSKNWVYMDFYRPYRDGTLSKEKQFIQSLVTDNPDIDPTYYKNLLKITDVASKERLLYGNWDYDDDPAALCEYDAICDLFTNDHVLPTGKKYISSDLAMQGRDRFVTGSWDGLICKIPIDKGKSTGKEIEGDLKALMIKDSVPHTQTVADSDGLGAYLESYLNNIKTFHGGAKANDPEFINLKSECGFKLAELVNTRAIKIICTDEQRQKIVEELGVLKRASVDADEKRKAIIDKKKMKELLGRSPDYLDMLLMRMLFEVKRKINFFSA